MIGFKYIILLVLSFSRLFFLPFFCLPLGLLSFLLFHLISFVTLLVMILCCILVIALDFKVCIFNST